MAETDTIKEGSHPAVITLALDRTILANERTYAAWIRTGIAALIAGLAVEKFLLEPIPLWGVHAIAVILIVFSALSFFLAAWRYRHLHLRLKDADVVLVPPFAMIGLSLVLIVSACIALIGLWLSW